MGQQPVTACAAHPRVIVRLLDEVLLRAGDVVLRVIIYPVVVKGCVIGNKVQHQTQTALPEPLA